MTPRRLFFCGIGGSGMMPLALLAQDRGIAVSGSDRSFDQGISPDKRDFLHARGIHLVPQDGAHVPDRLDGVIISSAVETNVPDVAAAQARAIPVIKRAELLARFFNDAKTRIAVGGTSGKSTTTAMIGWILHAAGLNPTIVNGAAMKNFSTNAGPAPSFVTGDPDLMVIEADESDGSIALYRPTHAVVTNISADHLPLADLQSLFGDFIDRSAVAVVNGTDTHSRPLLRGRKAQTIPPTHDIPLLIPGAYNQMNAAMAASLAQELGIDQKRIRAALAQFQGIKRRLETVGTAGGVTVIDDFAHNPDKIRHSLMTLRETPGRLLIFFQFHGYGPLKQMFTDSIDAFAPFLGPDDRLLVPPVLYRGGTVDRTVDAQHWVKAACRRGLPADYVETREKARAQILQSVRAGDRIIIMGARDDTLTDFAYDLLSALEEPS